jgi:hypothetical protein
MIPPKIVMPNSSIGKQNPGPGSSKVWVQILIVVVVTVLGIWWFRSDSGMPPQPKPQKKLESPGTSEPKKQGQAPEPDLKSTTTDVATTPSTNLAAPPALSGQAYIPSPMEILERKSQENLEKFGQKISLKMPFISGMQFIPYDFEEGVAALYGRDPQLDIDLSIFARKGVLTPEEVLAYFKQHSSSLPGLSKVSEFSVGEASTLDPPEGSGLAPLKVWQVELPGRSLRLALANRKDGKGSYVFLANAQSGVIDSGEEHFAKYYEKLRAVEPP